MKAVIYRSFSVMQPVCKACITYTSREGLGYARKPKLPAGKKRKNCLLVANTNTETLYFKFLEEEFFVLLRCYAA
jgi:hypothetical protein